MAALGGDGIISVAANAFTGKFCRMAHEALDGRFGEASALHMQMIEAIDALFEEGNPVGIKCALSCMGLIPSAFGPCVRVARTENVAADRGERAGLSLNPRLRVLLRRRQIFLYFCRLNSKTRKI